MLVRDAQRDVTVREGTSFLENAKAQG